MGTNAVSKFHFLAQDSPRLCELAVNAENRYRAGDEIGCVAALRIFGEEATRILLDGYGLNPDGLDYATQARRIEELLARGRISNFAYNGLHVLRLVGNEAVHEWNVSPQDACRCLEKAYKVALAERSVLAPRAQLNLMSAVEYEPPTFGEARLVIDDLVQENELLRQQLVEVQDLLQEQPEMELGADALPEHEPALDLATTVRLGLVVALSGAHQELDRLRQRSRRDRPRMPHSTAKLSEEFSRARKSLARLESELTASFFVERQLAALLARRHKATQIRRRMELEAIDWPEEWEREFRSIESQIQSMANASPVAAPQLQTLEGVEPIHFEIMDCTRRLVLAEALLREFRERGLDWPVAWARSHRALKLRRDQLITAACSVGSTRAGGPVAAEA